MMFQEFLINESQKFNEQITNLIHHEYIKISFLFTRRFMQRSFYIFMKKTFVVWNKLVSRKLLIIIDFVTRHAQSYFYLFIHIMCAIL